MKNPNRVFIAVIIILLAAVGYFAFRPSGASPAGPGPKGGEAAMTDNDFMKPHLPPALTDAQKAQLEAGKAPHSPTTLTFDIAGGSFFYAPNELAVREGDTVKMVFNDVGGVHNITFDDPKVATKTIKTGESDTVEFKAPKKGIYEFYCSVGKGYHRMMGQVGVLIVE